MTAAQVVARPGLAVETYLRCLWVRGAAEFSAHRGPRDERLPGDALIEIVFGDRFTRQILLTDRRVDPVPERWSARGHHARRRGRFAQKSKRRLHAKRMSALRETPAARS